MFDSELFDAKLNEEHVTKKELAAALNIDESTLYRKIKRGGDFTREEINKMIAILHIADPGQIFFTEKLA